MFTVLVSFISAGLGGWFVSGMMAYLYSSGRVQIETKRPWGLWALSIVVPAVIVLLLGGLIYTGLGSGAMTTVLFAALLTLPAWCIGWLIGKVQRQTA